MNQILCENLKRLRKDKRMTQEEVAKHLGLNPKTYPNYESGISEPNIETLKKLARLYNVTVDMLLGQSGIPDTESELLNIIRRRPDLTPAFRNLEKMTASELSKVMQLLEVWADEK